METQALGEVSPNTTLPSTATATEELSIVYKKQEGQSLGLTLRGRKNVTGGKSKLQGVF